jgi:hypothetical protein
MTPTHELVLQPVGFCPWWDASWPDDAVLPTEHQWVEVWRAGMEATTIVDPNNMPSGMTTDGLYWRPVEGHAA